MFVVIGKVGWCNEESAILGGWIVVGAEDTVGTTRIRTLHIIPASLAFLISLYSRNVTVTAVVDKNVCIIQL